MLNLMKFREKSLDGHGSGWDISEYSRAVIDLLKANRGTILWAGPVVASALGNLPDGPWDYVSLVLYPRPSAFIDMMTSAEYEAPNVERENRLNHAIVALAPTTQSLGVHDRQT